MNIKLLIFLTITLFFSGCETSFLEEKPDATIVNPKTLADCRRLLDNDGQLIQGLNYWFPAFAEMASDEYYYDKKTWQSLSSVQERNCYIWADDIYEGNPQINEWNYCFYAIYVSNVVLDVLNDIKVTDANSREYNDIKGTALFFRAFWNFAVAETFCLPYDMKTAAHELGIPLRKTANIDQLVQRSSLEETYAAIVDDLILSASLLENDVPTSYRNRPNTAAANALLARIYLVMGHYGQALLHANTSYKTYNELLDYSKLARNADAVFDRNNKEIMLMAQMKGYISMSNGQQAPNTFVDSTLVALYHPKDLRLQAYFTFTQDKKAHRKSLYTTGTNNSNFFNGLATDEVRLIIAECNARNGNLNDAKVVLQELYNNRFALEDVPQISFANKNDALKQILEERRKELLFRGMRWSDVRRLNVEGYNITLRRKWDNEEHSLKPNSLKYAFLLPLQEIQFTGLTQNKR